MSAQSGDICEACNRGTYYVYCSRPILDGTLQEQSLQCSNCKAKGGKVIKSASEIRRRANTYLSKRLNLRRR